MARVRTQQRMARVRMAGASEGVSRRVASATKVACATAHCGGARVFVCGTAAKRPCPRGAAELGRLEEALAGTAKQVTEGARCSRRVACLRWRSGCRLQAGLHATVDLVLTGSFPPNPPLSAQLAAAMRAADRGAITALMKKRGGLVDAIRALRV